MDQHFQTQNLAQTAHRNLKELQKKILKWEKFPLPHNKDGAVTPVQFHSYKESLLMNIRAADLEPILNGEINEDGPNPAPNEGIHELNRNNYRLGNLIIWTLVTKTFTAENNGYAHTAGLQVGEERQLYQRLVQHYERLQTHQRETTPCNNSTVPNRNKVQLQENFCITCNCNNNLFEQWKLKLMTEVLIKS